MRIGAHGPTVLDLVRSLRAEAGPADAALSTAATLLENILEHPAERYEQSVKQRRFQRRQPFPSASRCSVPSGSRMRRSRMRRKIQRRHALTLLCPMPMRPWHSALCFQLQEAAQQVDGVAAVARRRGGGAAAAAAAAAAAVVVTVVLVVARRPALRLRPRLRPPPPPPAPGKRPAAIAASSGGDGGAAGGGVVLPPAPQPAPTRTAAVRQWRGS